MNSSLGEGITEGWVIGCLLMLLLITASLSGIAVAVAVTVWRCLVG